MKNRIASLFELEQLLAPSPPPAETARRARDKRGDTRGDTRGGNGNGHASTGDAGYPDAGGSPLPAATKSPAARKRSACRKGTPRPISQSFDSGAPIHCQHDVQYPTVERADVPSPGESPPPARASALDLHVEAFEDAPDDDAPTMLLSSDDESDGESDGEPLTLGVSEAYDWQPTPAPDESEIASDDVATSESFSAQMRAVEADLAELAARADHPRPNASTPPNEGEALGATTDTPSARKGHSVFDSMAEGMSYATEFRLPSVQLSQVFSALDQQLDADDVTPNVTNEATHEAPPAEMPGGDVLLADLARLTTAPRAPASSPEQVAQSLGALIDVRHEVQLIPQQTGMSCWAAGAAMVVGWRDKISVDPSEIARGIGYWAQYAAGLNAEDTRMFATWRLTPEAARSYSVQGFADLLRRHGPLWVASAEPGPHVRVVTGMSGDGTPAGTQVHILDPWEAGMVSFRLPNAGASYTESYQRFVEKQETLGRQESRLQGIYVAHA